MEYKLTVRTISEIGQRTGQEDSIYPAQADVCDGDRLFILCDGMGGHDAGEVASATVCEAMGRRLADEAKAAPATFTDEMLQRGIDAAFDALDRRDTGAARKMGTTMTMLRLHSGGATIAHMGDSRVYHIRPGRDGSATRVLFVTRDHSLVNDLVKVGELTEEEARHSPQRNIITRAMQPHMERRPVADIHHTADIQAGDYFYLCSDGMLENMTDQQICTNFADNVGTDDDKVERLTLATAQNRDNHTAIIVHILAVEGEAIAPAPVVLTANDRKLMAEVVDDKPTDGQQCSPQDNSTADAHPQDNGTVETRHSRVSSADVPQDSSSTASAPQDNNSPASTSKPAKPGDEDKPKRKSLPAVLVAIGVLVIVVFGAVMMKNANAPSPAPTPKPQPIVTPIGKQGKGKATRQRKGSVETRHSRVSNVGQPSKSANDYPSNPPKPVNRTSTHPGPGAQPTTKLPANTGNKVEQAASTVETRHSRVSNVGQPSKPDNKQQGNPSQPQSNSTTPSNTDDGKGQGAGSKILNSIESDNK